MLDIASSLLKGNKIMLPKKVITSLSFEGPAGLVGIPSRACARPLPCRPRPSPPSAFASPPSARFPSPSIHALDPHESLASRLPHPGGPPSFPYFSRRSPRLARSRLDPPLAAPCPSPSPRHFTFASSRVSLSRLAPPSCDFRASPSRSRCPCPCAVCHPPPSSCPRALVALDPSSPFASLIARFARRQRRRRADSPARVRSTDSIESGVASPRAMSDAVARSASSSTATSNITTFCCHSD